MIPFTPSGDLLTDLQMCITNTTAMRVTYTDKKGVASTRVIAPVEVRGNGVYLFSMEKNGHPDLGHGRGDIGLRFFLMSSMSNHQVLDRRFDPNSFKPEPEVEEPEIEEAPGASEEVF